MKKQLLLILVTLLSYTGWSQEEAFITKWQTTTDSESIIIPTGIQEAIDNEEEVPEYNYTVDWGDGSTDVNQTNNATHTYATAGTYTVSITGVFPWIFFDNKDNADKIISIEQWGDIAWSSFEHGFRGCANLTYNATDTPDLSNVTDMSSMFENTKLFNGDLSSWDVSNVEDMSSMFEEASAFNGNLSTWNVSNVTSMYDLFYEASSFNGDISNWNVGKATDMSYMFQEASSFNGDISNWNVSSVTYMSHMFQEATSFNGDISNWNVGKVTNMLHMFQEATSFNQDLSKWNVSSATNMSSMFQGASFNGDVSTWVVSSVEKMYDLFYGATAFNQDLSDWNVSNVDDMEYMFYGATSFDGDLSSWNISKVEYFEDIFKGVTLSTLNYTKLLNAWSELNVQENQSFHGGNSKYCTSGTAARNKLINEKGWTITDGGEDSTANCSTLSINSKQITDLNVLIYKLNETTLRSTGLPKGKTTIVIYNIIGKQVSRNSFDTSSDVKDISLPKLPQGVYLVNFETEKGSISKKIIL